MILARQVFQIKYGQMDKVMGALKAAEEAGLSSNITRVLTDISGPNFTLIFETKAESVDAYWEGLRAAFEDAETTAQMANMMPYVESGHREFYTIEYEAEG